MKTQRWMARVGVVLGIAVFGLVPISSGQECPEYVGELRGDLWEGAPNRIEVSGSFAYLGSPERCGSPPGCRAQTIAIADVSVPEEPRVFDFLRVGALLDFTVSGDRLYLQSAGRGSSKYLGIIDVTNPSHPVTLLDRLRIDDLLQIAVSGDIVLNATSDGLLLLDASDPSNPTEVGFLASPWGPSDLVVEGDFAYVAVPESGLRVIDVSDPAHPVEVGSWAATWEALDLEVRDGFAFVADGVDGLRVIDVTDPTEPAEISIFETEFEASTVSVEGDVAAVVLREAFIQIVDVSDPANPKALGSIETEGAPLAASISGPAIYISEGTEFDPEWGGYFNDGRFRVVDLSDQALPADLASFGYRSAAMDVEVADGEIFVAGGDAGLLVFDDSNPDGPLIGFLDTPGFALGVTLQGGFAFVADDHRGLRIIDVADPSNMVEVGYFDTPGEARRVAVAGDHAYVADGEGGLRIIDISTPEEPIEVGAVDTPEPAVDVVVEGDYAYVADGHLQIFDVSDPTNPVGVGINPIPAWAVAVKDRVLYLAGTNVSVYSLRSPRSPQILASGKRIPVMNEPTRIVLSGDHAYVTTRWVEPQGPGGRAWVSSAVVEVFEIENQYFPSLVGKWKSYSDDFWGAAVSDGRIYLAGGGAYVDVLDNRCLTTYWVEAVTHADGFNGSQWRSDVFISHEAESSVGFDFVLHTVDGEFTAEASVDAGDQGVFEDIVDLLGYRGTGALEIRATDPMQVTSRVYSESDPGTYGAFLQAYRSSDSLGGGRLNGLRQVEGEFRTNISVTNTSDESRTVEITLYRTDGEELVRYRPHVNPGMVFQDVRPFKNRAGEPNLGWGYATVETVGGGNGIVACASVIDSRTNDALIVPLLQ